MPKQTAQMLMCESYLLGKKTSAGGIDVCRTMHHNLFLASENVHASKQPQNLYDIYLMLYVQS